MNLVNLVSPESCLLMKVYGDTSCAAVQVAVAG